MELRGGGRWGREEVRYWVGRGVGVGVGLRVVVVVGRVVSEAVEHAGELHAEAEGDGVSQPAVPEHVDALLGAVHVFFPGGGVKAVQLLLGDAVEDGDTGCVGLEAGEGVSEGLGVEKGRDEG